MKFTSLLPVLMWATLVLTACGTSPAATDEVATNEIDKALQIVTTFAPLYQHTLNIADDNDTVTNLVPAGTSVHTRQPTPQDIATLENADIVITNGLGLEEFLEEYLHDLEERGVMIVDTSIGIATRELASTDEHHEDEHHEDEHKDDDSHENEQTHEEEHADEDHGEDEHTDEDHNDHHHTGTDPHIWLSIPNAQIQADTITQALTDTDPSQMMIYLSHNADYQTKLTILDQEIRAMIASADIQPFVVFHDAYGYYLHEYGIADKQVDMILEHHSDTPTQAEIAELIEHINEYSVATIFVEPQFSSTVVEALQQETGVNVREIDPIGSQMDADGYLTNIRSLTETLTQP